MNAGARIGAWRNRLVIGTTGLLVFATIAHMYFVVPSYRRLMQGVGAAFSLPARLAISISHFALLIVGAGIVGVAIALRKERQGATGIFGAAVAFIGLLAAAYLALVSSVYADFARLAARLQ